MSSYTQEPVNTFVPNGRQSIALLSDEPSFQEDIDDESAPADPLPKLQIAILLLLQLSEPITTHIIFPFINELVRGLDITGGDPKKTAHYVGLIESVFFITESITILPWSMVSDRVGRKPILLLGVAGLCLSAISFGLSRTFWALVLSRCIAGLLCANAGVRKSALGEMTTPSNRAQAAALMPLTWSVGATIGPFIGGTLWRPREHFPSFFTSPFWDVYPALLPCLVAATFSTFAFTCAYFYFHETLADKAMSTDEEAERQALLSNNDDYLGIQPSSPERSYRSPPWKILTPFRAILTYPVILSVSCYASLAVLGSSVDALQSVFYATSIELGGLGLPPRTIGYCLSTFAFINGTLQACFFAPLVKRFGPRRLFLTGVTIFVPVFGMFPLINTVARKYGTGPVVWCLLIFQLVLLVSMDMAYSCMFIFITAAAPESRSLGATNGIAQSAVALARAIGPALSTSLFSLSLKYELLGGYAVYVAMMGLTCLVYPVAWRLPHRPWGDVN